MVPVVAAARAGIFLRLRIAGEDGIVPVFIGNTVTAAEAVGQQITHIAVCPRAVVEM